MYIYIYIYTHAVTYIRIYLYIYIYILIYKYTWWCIAHSRLTHCLYPGINFVSHRSLHAELRFLWRMATPPLLDLLQGWWENSCLKNGAHFVKGNRIFVNNTQILDVLHVASEEKLTLGKYSRVVEKHGKELQVSWNAGQIVWTRIGQLPDMWSGMAFDSSRVKGPSRVVLACEKKREIGDRRLDGLLAFCRVFGWSWHSISACICVYHVQGR